MRTFAIQKDAGFDREFFARVNPGYEVTGELLAEAWDGGSQTLVVFRGPSTVYGMCRDCGDHYIIARWDRYDRVDKGSMRLTLDVEDY